MIKNFYFFNESNSYENLKNDLKSKLLSLDGDNVILGIDTEKEMNRMILDGRLFNEEIIYVVGLPNRCHANVANRSRREKGFNIVSGYALSDGIWYCHSWGYNKHKKVLFETTKNKYIKYYGYELNKIETENFCDEN